MGKSLPLEGSALPPQADTPGATLDRIASFRLTYVAILCFVLLYVFSVKGLERWLGSVFEARVEAAIRVDPGAGDVVEQIQERVDAVVRSSAWTRFGGVKVSPIVMGADGSTPLYLGGRGIPPPVASDPIAAAERLLPASADVTVTVPHNSLAANAVLVLYAALLIQTLFLYERRRSRVEGLRLEAASAARDESAARAARIETELATLGRELEDRVEAEVAEEIEALRNERGRLQEQLAALARREDELRAQAGQLQETLQSERQSLEELLDDALADLARKDEELRGLSDRLQRASQAKGDVAAPRARDLDQLASRLRTLYRNLEFDDHALRNVVALGDEAMRLRAEESIKRLDTDVETAAVRRKVGGLPAHLTIFELGFAGKGRIYYTLGRQRRFRILAVGAKNSQKTDLEYLSRLPRE
ncbi:MAG: hypothetical protein OZ948_02765 [Deltaproteobacteria bacterium]|nr:hypothetical protein [Deltaproteobacteria bacterium]